MFDVTRLSSKLARVYVLELARRLSDVTGEVEAILAGDKDVRSLDPATKTRIGVSLATKKVLLYKLALGAEWIRRPGDDVVEPLPGSVGDRLVRLEALLKRLDDGGMSMQEELSAVGAARHGVTPRD